MNAVHPTPRRAGAARAAHAPSVTRATLASLLAATLFSGCAVEPWVKPYERERLADPLMQLQRGALAERHREHVHVVREGARGATGVQGGGCGCN